MRRFVDGAGDASVPLDDVLTLALLFVGIALGQQILGVLRTYAGQRVSWAATNAVREDLTLHCLQLDMPFHANRTPGEMIERIDGDVSSLASFFSQFAVRILGNILMLIGTLAVFTAEDWRLGTVMTVYAALTSFALSRLHNIAVPFWRAAREAAADLFGFLEERLSGTVDIRALGAVPYAMRRLYHFTGDRLARELKASVVNIRMRYVETGSYAIGQVLTVSAGYYLYREVGVTIGTVAMLVYYMDLLFRPLSQLMSQMEELQQAGASVGRVRELFQERSAILTPEPKPPPSGMTVEFQDVSFGYHEETVLDRLSFDVQAGRILGLLGRTGSGKTTITRLLFRLYDPQQGTVRLGGTDLRRIVPEALRDRVGIVTQSVQLFSGTVRDNLTLFDDGIPADVIGDVMRGVGMGSWLDALPDGLDSMLESDGGGLSAGEAQLLTLARVFLRDPGLVILDEASSRLDPATEAQIERAVNKLLQGVRESSSPTA